MSEEAKIERNEFVLSFLHLRFMKNSLFSTKLHIMKVWMKLYVPTLSFISTWYLRNMYYEGFWPTLIQDAASIMNLP